jgi:cytochrome c553
MTDKERFLNSIKTQLSSLRPSVLFEITWSAATKAAEKQLKHTNETKSGICPKCHGDGGWGFWFYG